MLRRGAARVHACLLAAIVLGGWVGLPAADALLYHRGPGHEATGPRLDQRGAPLPHGLRCSLGAACPGSRLASRSAGLPPGYGGTADRTPPPHPDEPRGGDRSGIPQPRAPPISSR